MTASASIPTQHIRRGWWDAPICPVVTCAGPGTMGGSSLRCSACGGYWTGTPAEIAKARTADAMWGKFEDRPDPRVARRRAPNARWLPGIPRRVEVSDPRVLHACGVLHIPLGVSLALALVGSHGARVELHASEAWVYGGTRRVRELMASTGAQETTLCNVPAWVWTR